MKKTGSSVFKMPQVFVILLSCLFLFNFTSCGLDVFYYLDQPTAVHTPSYTDEDTANSYFVFTTKETDDNVSNGTFEYEGTKVVYKIYDSKSEMISRESRIASKSSSTVANPMAATELLFVNDDGYGYKELLIIEATGSDRNIYINLTDRGTVETQACTCIGTSTFDSSKIAYDKQPVRVVDKPFIFDNSSGVDWIPSKDSDGDFYSTEDGVQDVYYVDMYAISWGVDSITPAYSAPVFLGSVKIERGRPSSSD